MSMAYREALLSQGSQQGVSTSALLTFGPGEFFVRWDCSKMFSSISGFYLLGGNDNSPLLPLIIKMSPDIACRPKSPLVENHWFICGFLQGRNKWFIGEYLTASSLGEKAVRTVCQFLWCKHSLGGWFQATNACKTPKDLGLASWYKPTAAPYREGFAVLEWTKPSISGYLRLPMSKQSLRPRF